MPRICIFRMTHSKKRHFRPTPTPINRFFFTIIETSTKHKVKNQALPPKMSGKNPGLISFISWVQKQQRYLYNSL